MTAFVQWCSWRHLDWSSPGELDETLLIAFDDVLQRHERGGRQHPAGRPEVLQARVLAAGRLPSPSCPSSSSVLAQGRADSATSALPRGGARRSLGRPVGRQPAPPLPDPADAIPDVLTSRRVRQPEGPAVDPAEHRGGGSVPLLGAVAEPDGGRTGSPARQDFSTTRSCSTRRSGCTTSTCSSSSTATRRRFCGLSEVTMLWRGSPQPATCSGCTDCGPVGTASDTGAPARTSCPSAGSR